MSEKLSCLEGAVVEKLNAMASKVHRTEAQCQRIATRVDARQHDPKRHFMYKRRPTSPNVYTVPTCLVPEGSPHRSAVHKRAVQFSHPTIESDSAIIAPTDGEEEENDENESSIVLTTSINKNAARHNKEGGNNVEGTSKEVVSTTSHPSATSEETLQDIINSYDCLLYTSDAADEEDSVDLGGRRIIKNKKINYRNKKRTWEIKCSVILKAE
eukprot:TRINITY_DN50489_c0_g1_i1.p1 TRINITY_DN50489_c0_g1~~TRINITY_DN50489_c0_g1_i1.p1  ORF type:complete len:213 (+),score=29.12 TRINITY_DN50489_c0_g1_i1:291-929(+)